MFDRWAKAHLFIKADAGFIAEVPQLCGSVCSVVVGEGGARARAWTPAQGEIDG